MQDLRTALVPPGTAVRAAQAFARAEARNLTSARAPSELGVDDPAIVARPVQRGLLRPARGPGEARFHLDVDGYHRRNRVRLPWQLGILLLLVIAAAALVGACAHGSAPSRLRARPASVDTGRVEIEGGSLFWEATGNGSPVVLLHGGNLDRRMWDPQFEVLGRQYRVIRYDARGFGRSSPADAPFSAHDDLAALLRGLRVPRASLVGLSMGGRIAIDFALRNPDMVDRLVLAAPGVSGGTWADDGDSLWLAAAHAAARRGDSVAVALAWLESAYIRTALHPPGRAAWIRRIVLDNVRYWGGLVRHQDLERQVSPPAAGRLGDLRAPILLLVGDRDTPFIHDVARAIADRAPRVRRVDLKGVGHMLNLEAADDFNRAVLEFLRTP